MKHALRRKLVEWYNRLRGHYFYAEGECLQFSEGTCPYPLLDDWSAKACVRAGLCGCSHGREP